MGVIGAWALAHNRLSTWAQLSSSSLTAGDMPLRYLQEDQPTDRVRFTQPQFAIVFEVDLAAAMAAQGVSTWRLLALLYNNSSATGTIEVHGAASAAGINSPTYLSGQRLMWPSPDCGSWPRIHTRIWEPAGRSETYLRIILYDPLARKQAETASGFDLAGYVDVGNLFVDFGLSYLDISSGGVVYSSPIDGIDQEARQVQAEGGPDFSRWRPQRRTKSFDILFTGPNARAEYYGKVEEFRRYTGNARPVVLFEDLDATTFQMSHSVMGLMTMSDVSIPQNNYFHLAFRIVEML